jgi:hypothetical protein
MDTDLVSARVALRLALDEARRRVQRLVHVAHEVQQPDEIVRFHVVGRARLGELRTQGLDLRADVRRVPLLQRRPVGRERLIDEVPIFVPEVIGVADVLRRFRSRRRPVAVVRAIGLIGVVALDGVGPGRGADEGDLVALSRRDAGNPAIVFRIELEQRDGARAQPD